MKKKKNFSKKKRKEIVSLNFVSRIKKVLNEESCRGVKVMLCYSLNYH